MIELGGYIRTNAKMDQLGFVRGPAMIYAAPLTQAPPDDIGDILRLTGTENNEVQTLTITGTPTGGTFKLNFKGVSTAAIAYNATAAAVQLALEATTSVGAGNILCAGGPLPGSPVTLTFQNSLGNQDVPTISVVAAALTGGTTPAAAVAVTTPGQGIYDPLGSWFALGGTKDGVNPTMNDAEEEFTIDQQQAAIGALPTTIDWGITTSLVEVTLENLAFAWDMGAVTLNTTVTPNEKKMGMGVRSVTTQRRVAVIHRRTIGSNAGLLRCHFFRIGQRRAGTEVTLGYASTGEQQRTALNLRCLPDDAVLDDNQRVGYVLDQMPG